MSTVDTITLSCIQTGTSPQSTTELVVPRQLGRVILDRELGRGGMGTVWLGHDELLGRPVAVKFLLNALRDPADPGFLRFLEGARAAAAVRHSRLTTLFAAEVIDNVPYLVMEYVEGPSTADVLVKRGPLDLAAALAIADAVADALAALHDRQIIHRDIKPANILLDSEGRVFVTDFGLAIHHERSAATDSIAGTPAYMAPEMYDGAVSFKSDIYALGITLYELLTAVRPFNGAGPNSSRGPMPKECLHERHVPGEVVDLLERAVHVNPMFRQKSAASFQQSIREVLPGHASQRATRAVAALVTGLNDAPSEPSIARSDAISKSASSYFDELSSFAARRKGETSAALSGVGAPAPDAADGQYAQTSAPPASPAERLPDHGAVPCIHCEYDLRGQRQDAKCPECGRLIIDSAAPDRLLYSSSRWLNRVVLGIGILRWSYALAPLTFMLILSAMEFDVLPSDRTLAGIGMAIVGLIIIGPMVGVWLATARQPADEKLPITKDCRRLARISIVLATIACVFGNSLLGNLSAEPQLVLKCSAALLAAATVLTFGLHVSKLLSKIPTAKLARRTRLDSLVLAMLIGAMAVVPYFRSALGRLFALLLLFVGICCLLFWFRLGAAQRALQRVKPISP